MSELLAIVALACTGGVFYAVWLRPLFRGSWFATAFIFEALALGFEDVACPRWQLLFRVPFAVVVCFVVVVARTVWEDWTGDYRALSDYDRS